MCVTVRGPSPKVAPVMYTVRRKKVRWRGEGGRKEGEARKHKTYSGAKCGIVERWFSVNGNFEKKCISTHSPLRGMVAHKRNWTHSPVVMENAII
jgi:hypothetical protein